VTKKDFLQTCQFYPVKCFFFHISPGHQYKKGGDKMALMRAFARVEKDGKISIPGNIRREIDLKEGQLVEIKVSGPKRAQYVVIHKRKTAR